MRRSAYLGILLVLPILVLFGVTTFYPLAYAVYLSFHYVYQLSAPRFVGLNNYIFLVNNPRFWSAFGVGLIWTFGTLAGQIVMGLVTALVLNEPFKGRGVARGLILLPYVVPAIAAIMLFRMSIFHSSIGFIDQVLNSPIPWLGDPLLALVTLIGVGIWKFYPFVTMVFLARLQSIPKDLYDSAKVDGAPAYGRFRHVTLPALLDVLLVTLLLRTIFMYTKFDIPYLLTGGGPGGATETTPILAYIVGFHQYLMGMGSALGVTIFLVLLVMAFLYFRVYKESKT